MFFGKPASYLGVDLGAGGVKVVELRREKKRPVLFTYGFTSESQDVHTFLAASSRHAVPGAPMLSNNLTIGGFAQAQEKMSIMEADASADRVGRYASIVKAVCAESRVVSKTAVVSLPVSAVFHAVVTMPALKKDEFDRVLKAEIKKLLPYPLEETSLDYQILPFKPTDKDRRVLVNAVPRSLVVFYTKVFQAAGLKLDSLEPESMALSRSLIGRDTAVTMLVDIGAERTNFFIIDHTIPVTHHSIEMGGVRMNRILTERLGVGEPYIEQMKHDMFAKMSSPGGQRILSRDRFLELTASIIDPIMKEIEYGFEVYLRQSGNEQKRPEKVVLTGGGAYFPYLAEYIAEKFRLKCYIGDPWGRVVYQDSLKSVLGSIGPRMSVAIGLALRYMV